MAKRLSLIFMSTTLSVPALAAKERVFEFSPTTDAIIEYVQGEQVAIQERASSAVAIRFVPYDKKRAWIEVVVENRGPESVLVAEGSLTAFSKGEPLEVHTYDELMREQRKAERWRAVAAGMAAAGNSMSAANAGYSQQYGTYNERTSASMYGSNGSYLYGTGTTTGTYSSTTYNAGEAAAAQQAANERNRRLVADMEAANQRDRNSLDLTALRANTLHPQSVISGSIMIDLPKRSRKESVPLQVRFTVGEDQFTFSLVETPK